MNLEIYEPTTASSLKKLVSLELKPSPIISNRSKFLPKNF